MCIRDRYVTGQRFDFGDTIAYWEIFTKAMPIDECISSFSKMCIRDSLYSVQLPLYSVKRVRSRLRRIFLTTRIMQKHENSLFETQGNDELSKACKQAIANRQSDNEASHALVHRSLIASRLKDSDSLTDASLNL